MTKEEKTLSHELDIQTLQEDVSEESQAVIRIAYVPVGTFLICTKVSLHQNTFDDVSLYCHIEDFACMTRSK